ncbi:MAG: TIGR03668 family PPOX class F420-dependent oxidoreductase [Pseudomonadales bacterium]|jgi:PPOX class probable F420-dependent enzyme
MEPSEEILRLMLATWPVGRLATASRSGRPHVVPIVFCTHEGEIFSPLDGKRKRGRSLRRFSNLAENPSAALLLDEYDSDWQQLWWVRIDGEADWFEPDAGRAERVARLLLEKYPQYQDPELAFDRAAYLRLRPSRVTAWTQSGSMAGLRRALEKLGRKQATGG